MKHLLLSFVLFTCVTDGFSQNYLDQYLSNPITYTNVGGSANQVNVPRDLDFKPNTNELWVLNKGNSSGGSVVIFHNAGLANQSSQYKKDSHAGHFMVNSSSMAFGDDNNWGSVGEVLNTNGSSTSTFMGPSLWSGDLNIFASVFQSNWASGTPLGSHLDMLHQSPFGMGIAHDNNLVYWVFDGYNGNICKYNYVMDHGPGYEDHSAGIVARYTDVPVLREQDVPSHMVVDKANDWLYFVDSGNKNVKRLKTTSGINSGNLSQSNETLAGYYAMTGATVEVVDTYPSSMPCGIDVFNGRLIVSDYANGDIYMYDVTGVNPVIMDTIHTGQAGIMGVKIGGDGKIWFVNSATNNVVRINVDPLVDDAAIMDIVAPSHVHYHAGFYSTQFNECNSSVVLQVTLMNSGTATLTAANLNYSVDGGSPSTMNWTGSIASGSSLVVSLPAIAFSHGEHRIKVSSSNPNGNPDSNPANDASEGSFRSLSTLASIPFKEDFSTTSFPPSNWSYVNYNPNNMMKRVSTAGGFGVTPLGCLKMDNFSAPSTGAMDITGQIDYFFSPRIDFSTATSGTVLEFNLAHARYNSSEDQLEVLVSVDCGLIWTSVYNKLGAALATAASTTSNFNPTASQWRKESINLDSYVGQSEIIVMFKTTSNYGNNVFIDDINVHNTTGLKKSAEVELSMDVYPNPSHSNLTVRISNGIINGVEMYNVLGEKMFHSKFNSAQVELDLSNQAVGVYFLRVESENGFITQKIIKQN